MQGRPILIAAGEKLIMASAELKDVIQLLNQMWRSRKKS